MIRIMGGCEIAIELCQKVEWETNKGTSIGTAKAGKKRRSRVV